MEQKKGLLLIFAASVLFSLGGLLIKVIPWQALTINSWRCGISVCMLLLFAKLTHHKLKLTPGVWAGAAAMCLTVSSYALANKLTTAANATVLENTSPLWIILFGAVLLRKRIEAQAAACRLLKKDDRVLEWNEEWNRSWQSPEL